MEMSEYEQLINRSPAELRHRIIPGEAQVGSFGRKEVLLEHFEMLRREFVGKSELEYVHAIVIVLLRRQVDVQQNFARFRNIWSREGDFLLCALNSRWLVSACDTLIDFAEEDGEIGFACAGTLLLAVVKLYETERRATKSDERADYVDVSSRGELFDGMTPFVIGSGDMVANLYSRIRRSCRGTLVSQRILLELAERLLRHDTVVTRLRARHVAEPTKW